MLTKLEVSTDWQTDFTEWMRAKGKGRLTVIRYNQNLLIFTRWYEEENHQAFSPDFLTNWDMQAFRRWSLEVQRVRPATWNNRLSALSALQEWCREMGHIEGKPLDGIFSAESETLAPHWLDQADFSRFMRQLELERNKANTQQRRDRAVRDAALVSLMVFAGLRVGEVVALRQSDLEINDRSGRVIIRLGKGEKFGEIPLSKEARRFLAEWLALQPADPRCLVFGNLTTRSVQLRMTAISKAAGVSCTPHQLRHTCAKRILDAGNPITVVQKILRHKNLNTTARYLQPSREDLQSAVDSITLGRK